MHRGLLEVGCSDEVWDVDEQLQAEGKLVQVKDVLQAQSRRMSGNAALQPCSVVSRSNFVSIKLAQL